MCNIIPEERRGRFLGFRNTLAGIVALCGTCLAGFVLSWLPFPESFSIIFLGSFGSVMISFYFLNKQLEPLLPEYGETKKTYRSCSNPGVNLGATFATFRHPQYGYIFSLSCLALFIFHIGFTMAIPLYTLRQVQQLGYSNAVIALIIIIQSLTSLTGSYLGGLYSDRFGYRFVLLYSTLLSVIPPLVWAVFNQLPLLIVAAILAGLAGNAYMICFLYMVLAVSPQEGRAHFVGMNTVVGNVAGMIGPLFGMGLIPFLGIQGALMVAGLIMLIGSIFSYQVAKKGTF
jgi:MFS family permease